MPVLWQNREGFSALSRRHTTLIHSRYPQKKTLSFSKKNTFACKFNSQTIVNWKNKPGLKVESWVYSAGIVRTSSPGDSALGDPERTVSKEFIYKRYRSLQQGHCLTVSPCAQLAEPKVGKARVGKRKKTQALQMRFFSPDGHSSCGSRLTAFSPLMVNPVDTAIHSHSGFSDHAHVGHCTCTVL